MENFHHQYLKRNDIYIKNLEYQVRGWISKLQDFMIIGGQGTWWKKYSISYLVNHWNFSSHNINPLHTLMTRVKARHFTASTDNLAHRLSIHIHTHTHTHTHTHFFFFLVCNLILIVRGLPKEIIQLLPSQRKKPKLFNPARKTYDK